MSSIPTSVLLAVIALLLVAAVVGFLLYSTVYGPKARLRRRISQAIGGGKAKGAGMLKGGVAVPAPRRKAVYTKLKELEAARLKKRGYKLREELTQAGLSITVRQFVFGSVAAGLAAAALAYVSGLPPLGLVAFPVAAGVGLPRLVLKLRIGRRLKKFTSQFADAIDVIVRGVRSGLPVGECLAMIAREMPDPVGTEFRLIVEGQRLGLTVDDALQKAIDRVPTAELRFFAIVIAIQQATGGNLAETLSKLSEVLRARKRMRDKVQAMSSEAKASAGIIGSLPVVVGLILSVVAPDYIGVLFRSDVGHLLLFLGVCIMGTGVLVMRQMIQFDI